MPLQENPRAPTLARTCKLTMMQELALSAGRRSLAIGKIRKLIADKN
jgi:hypothetical protein